MKFKVSEIFESIQGESTFQGLSCLFIRLFGCNLSCDFCDALYTRIGNRFFELSVDEVVRRVKESRCNLIEFTGGEPLLQKRLLAQVLWRLRNSKKKILIETNGTLKVFPLHVLPVRFIVDVKPPEEGIFEHKNFKWLNERNSELKFLVGKKEHVDFVFEFLERNEKEIKTKVILISPIFSIEKKILFESCDWNGLLLGLQKTFPKFVFRLNVQIHKVLGVR